MKKIYFSFIAILLLGISSLSAQNTDGTEFWLTFGRNSDATTYDSQTQQGYTTYELGLQIRLATRDLPASGKIYFMDQSNGAVPPIIFNIPPQTVRTYTLSSAQKRAVYNSYLGTSTQEQITNKSIFIKSDNNAITAYAMSFYYKSTDATNLLPVPVLGKDYYQISYTAHGSSNYDDAYAVIATQDGTDIFHDGVKVNATPLNAGQVYYRSLSKGDMTGKHITSNNPVAFFVCNLRAWIPTTKGNTDCLMQQLAPVETWGKNFFVPVSSLQKDRVRILASQDGTIVSQSGGYMANVENSPTLAPTTINLNKGSFYEIEIRTGSKGCFIQSQNYPIGVCTYLTGSQYNGYSVSDPAICWVPAIEQTAIKSLMSPFAPNGNTFINTHYALIFTPAKTKDNTKIYKGGVLQPALSPTGWTVKDSIFPGIPSMAFYTYQFTGSSLDTIPYQFTNNDGLMVLGYGTGADESYYYLGYSSMRNFKAFYTANTVHYGGNFSDHLFCEPDRNITFKAKFEDFSSVSDIKWFIDGIQQTDFDHDTIMTHHFDDPGAYLIRMDVVFGGDLLQFEGILHIGTKIHCEPNNTANGYVSLTDTCVLGGEPLPLIAYPEPSYIVDHWESNGVWVAGETNTYTPNTNEDNNIVAFFRLNTVDITVNVSPTVTPACGSVTITGGTGPNGNTFEIGDLCKLKALETNPCYKFLNWTEGNTVVEPDSIYDFVVTRAQTLTANFEIIEYEITASALTPGTGNVSGSNTYNCGANATVAATPATGYHFVEWLENGVPVTDPNAQNSSYTFRVDSARDLQAKFALNTYNLIVSPNPSTYGTACCDTLGIEHFSNYTVTAVESDSCDFIGWKIGGVTVSTNPTFIIAIEAPYFTVNNSTIQLVANFKLKDYVLTLTEYPDNTTGGAFGGGTYPHGSRASISAVPVQCFAFEKWTFDDGTFYSAKADTSITVKKNLHLVAHFVPKQYQVNVTASPSVGGTATGSGQFLCHETCTVTATPNLPRYKFSHWEDYGVKIDTAGATYTFSVRGDHELVAYFVKETVIIHVKAEPEGEGHMVYSGCWQVPIDSLCFVYAEPADECHSFTKWTTLDYPYTLQYNDPYYEFRVYPDLYTDFLSEGGIVTLVAHFRANTYDLRLDPLPLMGGDVSANGTYGGGTFSCDEKVEIKAEPRPHYKFVKWVEVIGSDTTQISTNAIDTIILTGPRRLIAIFELETFHITVLPNPANAGTAGTGGDFPYGTIVPLLAKPFSEWEFYNWSDKNNIVFATDSAYNNYSVTGSDTLYANFIPRTFTVKVAEDPPGIGCPVTGNGTQISYGTLWDITAKPVYPYEFLYWKENGNPLPNPPWDTIYTIFVNRDFDLKAVFAKIQYEITLEADPPTGGNTTGGGIYPHGTPIVVEAIANNCHTFSHWTENDVLVGSFPALPFTVTGPRHLVAHFIPEMYEITVTADPISGGTPTGGGIKPCLSEITVSANTDPCYDFVGWTENGDTVSTMENFTFTVDGPRNLIAHFVQKMFNITTSVIPNAASPGSGYIVVSGGDTTDILCGVNRQIEAFGEIGWKFNHWTVCGRNIYSNPYTFAVTDSCEVVAYFDSVTHYITLIPSPTGWGQADTGGYYPHGWHLTVHATPNPEFDFINWTENGREVSTDADYQFDVLSDRTLTANFDWKTLTVTTDPYPRPGGTTAPRDTSVSYGSWITLSAVANPHFTFDQWKWEDGTYFSDSAIDSFPVTQSCRLVAHFKPDTYCVIAEVDPDPDGGKIIKGGGCNLVFGTVDTLIVQASPNYVFDRWTENDSTISKFNPLLYTVSHSCTKVAHFKPKGYDIIVEADPKAGGNAFSSGTNIPYGTIDTVHAIANSCYEFVNWTEYGSTIELSKLPDFPFPVTQSLHLVAHFKLKTFTVIPVADPPYGGAVWDTLYNVACGTDTIVHAQENLPHFSWGGWWYENGTPASAMRDFKILNITQSLRLIARFNTESYLITLSADPSEPTGGILAGSGTFDYGMTIPITATPNSCYVFAGWYEADTLFNPNLSFNFTVDGPRHFVAHFVQKLFAVTTTVFGSGTITVTGDTTDIPCKTPITITATPNTGYVFDYWMVCGTKIDTSTYTFEVTDSCEIVAYFNYVEHFIKLIANPLQGQADTSGYYPHHTYLTVYATEKPGYMFTYWSENGDTVYTNPRYSFFVDSARTLVAHFDSAKYRVTTIPNDTLYGTTAPADTTGLSYGVMLTVTATAKTNYNFKYWTENGTPILPPKPNYTFSVQQNRDLVAVFEPQNFSITTEPYLPDYGKTGGDKYNIPYGTLDTVWAEAFPNYDFNHWEENGEDIGNANPYKFTVKRSRHLVAIFTPKNYDILVWANPGGYGKAWDSQYAIPYKTPVTVHAKPNQGRMFVGWYENGVPLGNTDTAWTFPVNGSRNLEARFALEKCTVTLVSNPTGGGVVWDSGVYDFGETITVHEKPNLHYTFVNWTDEDGNVLSVDTPYTFTVIRTCTITANFTGITSKITLLADPPEGGILTGGGDIVQGTDHTITATPNPCYDFVNWTENGVVKTTTPDYTFTLDENNHTFVAHFALKYLTITTSANPPAGGTATGGGTNIACGDTVTVSATTNPGYEFVNWTKNGTTLSTDSIYRFPSDESCELVANFKQTKYTITVAANPPTLGAVAGGGPAYYGESRTITATPKPGYSFINWTEDGAEVSTQANYNFTVTQSHNFVANFDKTYYTVTVSSNDTLYGYAMGDGVFEPGQLARVSAYAKQGYRFLNWTINDTIISLLKTYEFPVTRSVHLVANFYGLDFDTYAATLWNNTFMLDLKKLAEEGYDVVGCKWFKNGREEIKTNTINQFSYSAGPKLTDLLEMEPTYYYFQVELQNGSLLYSTKKLIPRYDLNTAPTEENLIVYPNPAASGTMFTIENAVKNTLLQVYNQFGVCVKSITTSDTTIILSLDLPSGIYLIRNDHKETKLIIVR